MSLTPCDESGYGAASFWCDAVHLGATLEIQVTPTMLKIKVHGTRQRGYDQCVWDGSEAVVMGKAVCSGLPPAVLADWCEENEPRKCDRDFKPEVFLRLAH